MFTHSNTQKTEEYVSDLVAHFGEYDADGDYQLFFDQLAPHQQAQAAVELYQDFDDGTTNPFADYFEEGQSSELHDSFIKALLGTSEDAIDFIELARKKLVKHMRPHIEEMLAESAEEYQENDSEPDPDDYDPCDEDDSEEE